MATRKLTRWQKAGALVPMALLVTAWGAALSSNGLANAADTDAESVPDVPATAFGDPASVEATPGIDPRAGAANAVSTLSPNGIPSAALYAYRRAESLLGRADAECKLPWNLLAAIGRVESNHGRINGSSLDTDGLATPGIYGIPLDGRNGTARIDDTDGGKLDQDTVFDRAVGPMQFIPGTWSSVGVDANADGVKDPQDINDAATAAGVYLCAGPGDLSTDADARDAVGRYNRSSAYVDLVMEISGKYASGDYTESPNGYRVAPTYTNRSSDQTYTQAERKKYADKEQQSTSKPTKPGSGGNGTGGSTGGGSGTPGTPGNPGTGTPGTGTPTTPGGGSGGGSTSLGGVVDDVVGSNPVTKPLEPITKPVTETLTFLEAQLTCDAKSGTLLGGNLLNPAAVKAYKACMATYGYTV